MVKYACINNRSHLVRGLLDSLLGTSRQTNRFSNIKSDGLPREGGRQLVCHIVWDVYPQGCKWFPELPVPHFMRVLLIRDRTCICSSSISLYFCLAYHVSFDTSYFFNFAFSSAVLGNFVSIASSIALDVPIAKMFVNVANIYLCNKSWQW